MPCRRHDTPPCHSSPTFHTHAQLYETLVVKLTDRDKHAAEDLNAWANQSGEQAVVARRAEDVAVHQFPAGFLQCLFLLAMAKINYYT